MGHSIFFFEGGGGWKIWKINFLQSLYSKKKKKKIIQHERLLENACTAIKKIPAPLDSEKINSCTNSSTFPHKGQMVHP